MMGFNNYNVHCHLKLNNYVQFIKKLEETNKTLIMTRNQ